MGISLFALGGLDRDGYLVILLPGVSRFLNPPLHQHSQYFILICRAGRYWSFASRYIVQKYITIYRAEIYHDITIYRGY